MHPPISPTGSLPVVYWTLTNYNFWYFFTHCKFFTAVLSFVLSFMRLRGGFSLLSLPSWLRLWSFQTGLRTRTQKNSIILPNLNLNSKKYFCWTRNGTRIKLFEFKFTRKMFKLLERNKRSLWNIVCCSIVTTALTISMVLNSWGIVLNLLHEQNIFIFLIAWAPGGEKVVSILDIYPELELELEKAYFCRTRTWTRTC